MFLSNLYKHVVNKPNDFTKFIMKAYKPEPPISLINPFPEAFIFFWRILLMFTFISLDNSIILLLLTCWHATYRWGYSSLPPLHASFPFPQLPRVTSHISIFGSFRLVSFLRSFSSENLWSSEGEYLGNYILKLIFNQSLF